MSIYRIDERSRTWTPLPTTVDLARKEAIAQTSDIGSFLLQAPLLCPNDNQEPNDDYDSAKYLSVGDTPLRQVLDSQQDEDWYTFEALENFKYTVTAEGVTTSTRTIVEIYDQDGQKFLARSGGSQTASRVDWQAPTGGIYFVRIARTSNSSFGCSAEYNLSLTSSGTSVFLPLVVK